MTTEGGEIVVLTGASGCIGFHTLSLLIERDERVTEIRCIDLREPNVKMLKSIDSQLIKYNKRIIGNQANDKNADRRDVEEEEEGAEKKVKRSKKRVIWIKGDIRDLNLVERTLEGADCVIHAAARIDAWTYWQDQDADELYSVNVEGTETLLKTAQRFGVYKFIHVSSFETYIGYDTIYYATENTLPENKTFLFGASASTKWEAENKVRQYANVKLNTKMNDTNQCGKNLPTKPDQLLAVIIRFSTVYGEYDNHYVSKILKMTKFFNGKLQRMSNIWIKQQSIYARNAAWSLVKAKQRLDIDHSISGEEFHITDDTDIQDPFDFVEPFVESHGMQVTKDSYPFIPAWLLIWFIFNLGRFVRRLDIFNLFFKKKSRYQVAVEKDKATSQTKPVNIEGDQGDKHRWYHFVTPQTLCFMCNSSFLNRTKASLRLDYEPMVEADEALRNSLTWYRDELRL